MFIAVVLVDRGQSGAELLPGHPPGQHDVTAGHLDDSAKLDHSPIVVTNATDHFGR